MITPEQPWRQIVDHNSYADFSVSVSPAIERAVVEQGAMVAAGALVAPGKRVASGDLWVGSPARRARPVGDEEKEMMAYIARHYGELAAEYLARGAAAE